MSSGWSFSNDKPIYSQIVEQIKKQIVSGKLKPGDKLLTVRELASEAEVNPNTVQRALAELEQTGLIYSQRTSGRFITDDTALIRTMREEFAGEKIREFLESMKQMGYSKEETADLIRDYKEGLV